MWTLELETYCWISLQSPVNYCHLSTGTTATGITWANGGVTTCRFLGEWRWDLRMETLQVQGYVMRSEKRNKQICIHTTHKKI